MSYSDFKPSFKSNIFSLNDALLKKIYQHRNKYSVTIDSVPYPYVTSSAKNLIYLNGTALRTIYLYRGETYTFIQSDASNSGYQFNIASDTSGTSYTSGWTYSGTAGSNGVGTFVVSDDAPDTLYYHISGGISTQPYGGTIVINDLPITWPEIDHNYRKINFGYFIGGIGEKAPIGNQGVIGDIDKVNYLTNTANQVPDYLNTYRQYMSSAGNTTHGYIIGGNDINNTYSSAERIIYSTDTVQNVPSANCPYSVTRMTAVGNSSGDVHIFGGMTTNIFSYISGTFNVDNFLSSQMKLTTSTDNVSTLPSGNLPSSRIHMASAASPQNTGYVFIAGGQRNTITPSSIHAPTHSQGFKLIGTSDIHKVNLSTGSVSSSLSNLPLFGQSESVGRPFLVGVGGEKYVYFGSPGGSYPEYGRDYSSWATSSATCYSVEKFDVSTETRSGSLRSLPILTDNDATGHSTAGYFGGGIDRNYSSGLLSPQSSIHRLDYITDTSTTNSQLRLNNSRAYLTAVSPQEDNWTISKTGTSKIIEKSLLAYSSSTSSAPDVGYFVGGVCESLPSGAIDSPGTSGLIDTHNFSTDSETILPFAELSYARYYLTATGNSQFGYFCGGNTSKTTTSTGYGYVPYELDPNSVVEKLNYAIDTTSYDSSVQLTETVQRAFSISHSEHGYIAGGSSTPSSAVYLNPIKSNIQKINFKSDYISNIASHGHLLVARDSAGSVGNSSSGYFVGGLTNLYSTSQLVKSPGSTPSPQQPVSSSSIEKFTYSVETTSSLPSNLSGDRYLVSCIGNSSEGYFIGGRKVTNSSPSWSLSNISTIQKITYSTDTISPVPNLNSTHTDILCRGVTGNGTAALLKYGANLNTNVIFLGGPSSSPYVSSGSSSYAKFVYSTTTFTTLSSSLATSGTARSHLASISSHQNGLPGSYNTVSSNSILS